MCTTSACDLEEISLDDDDPNTIEFKILEFYVKHHVFKNTSAVFSPKLLRTRSLSQKGVGSWSANESWTQVSRPCRNSRSSEKPISPAKKKSSWRTLFGVIEKEEDSQSSPLEIQAEQLGAAEYQGSLHGQQRSRTLSNVEQRLEPEGRLLGQFFLSLNQISPFSVCMVVHLFPAGNVVLGRALAVPSLSKLLIFSNTCSTFLKTEQKGRGWQ